MSRLFRPPQVLWLLGHVIVFLLGIIVITNAALDSFLPLGSSTGIGGSLMASGMAGYVLYLYVYFSDQTRQQFESIWGAGLIGVFQGRSVAIKKEYDERIEKAAELDILGFGLSTFREDYGARFQEFAKTKNIRILVLDPDFPTSGKEYSAQRDKEEGNQNARIINEIREFIEFVKPIARQYPSRFKVRTLKALPSINYFRLDQEVLWGPYLIKMQSRNMPTLLVGNGGYLYRALKTHFDTLWSDEEFSAPI